MTGKQFKISRLHTSARFVAPPTVNERIDAFLNKELSNVGMSFKAATISKNPVAKNAPKRKKGKSSIKRFGMAVYDPNATWAPGKVYVPWIMKHNRKNNDTVPNVGWVDAVKTIDIKDVKRVFRNYSNQNQNKPSFNFSDSKPNPRTGGFEKKALGTSIGRIVPGGDIGTRAAAKIGLVADALGKLRCPPGVPAANQFTDSVGSNCFDFMPDVAKRLLNAAINKGQLVMSDINKIAGIENAQRRESGLIVPGGLIVPQKELIIPSLLGPDGKIVEKLQTIEPIVFADTVRGQLARDYPQIDVEERERIVALAEQRARSVQIINNKIKTAIDYMRELGIDVDENDPTSITAGVMKALQILKAKGWDVEFKNLLWGSQMDGFNDSLTVEEMTALHHKNVLSEIFEMMRDEKNLEKYFSLEELDTFEKNPELSPENLPRLRERVLRAILNQNYDSLSPTEKLVAERVSYKFDEFLAFEHGFLLSIIAEHKENPMDVELIDGFRIMDPMSERDRGTEGMMLPDEDGKLIMHLNPIGMILESPPQPQSADKWRLYRSNGKGLEIEQIEAISKIVDAGQRKQALDAFLRQVQIGDSSESRDRSKHLAILFSEQAGSIGRAVWIFQHELGHAKQYALIAYLISHDPDGKRLKGMTNAEIMSLADELLTGGNSLMSMESILSNPKVIDSAFAQIGPMVEQLVKDGVAGPYPLSHLNALNILIEIAQIPSEKEKIKFINSLSDEYNKLLEKPDSQKTAAEKNREWALSSAINSIEQILSGNKNFLQAIQQQRALMFAEGIVELNAAVKFGLVEPTDEIKQVLEHLNGPMDLMHKFKNTREEYGKFKISAYGYNADGTPRASKLSFDRKRKKRIRGQDITGESYTERQKRLIGDDDPISTLDSSESFETKKSIVSKFSKIKDKILSRATPKQQRAIEQELPEQNNGKILNDIGLINAELDASSNIRNGIVEGKTFDKKLEDDILPILDLMENNRTEQDLAVAVDVGDIKNSKNINRMSFVDFINFMRVGILTNKQKYELDTNPLGPATQKIIIKIPKGSKGIPDYDFSPSKPSQKPTFWPGSSPNTEFGLTDQEIAEGIESGELVRPTSSPRKFPWDRAGRGKDQGAKPRGVASVNLGLRSSSTAAATRSREILQRAKNKNIDIDAYERDRMPRVEEFGKSGRQNGEFYLGEYRFLVSEEKEEKRSKDIQEAIIAGGFAPSYDKTQWIEVDDKFILKNWFYGEEKEGFGVKLHILKLIASAQGDSEKVKQIDKLIDDVKKMSAEEFDAAVKDAASRLAPQFSQMISVEVDDPVRIIQSGRYLTAHEREKMKLANARGLSERDRFDIETVIRARSNVEQKFLGIDPSDLSEETTELRPASGYASTQNSIKRRMALLRELYGEEVHIQHPYAIGERARRSSADMRRYGDARIILRPEVAERALVFKGDSIANTGDYSTALKLSTIDESQYRSNFFDPMSILYADRTGDMDSIASPAENLPQDGKGDYVYQEAMILGSFEAQDVAALVISPQEARDSFGELSYSGFNRTADSNITSLIASAQLRENLSDKGIDVVLDSREFPLDEVEPFNASMTKPWIEKRIKLNKNKPNSIWHNLEIEQLDINGDTTPYEAYLQVINMKYGEEAEFDGLMVLFDHPDNEDGNNKKNQRNLSNMINAELKRLETKRAKSSSPNQGLRSNSASTRTAQTSRGEIGSMLLAPGRLKITGQRDDGTVVAELEEQKRPIEALSKLENSLKEIIASPNSKASHKIEARRALSVIKARRNIETSNNGLSTKLNSNLIVSKLPEMIDVNSLRILEKLKNEKQTWGNPISYQIEEMASLSDSKSSRFESNEQSVQQINETISGLKKSILKKDKKFDLLPEVKKQIEKMNDDDIRQNLIKAAKKYIDGLDKRPRFRFNTNSIDYDNSSELDKFLETGIFENPDTDKLENVKQHLRFGISQDASDSIRPVRGYLLHSDEINARLNKAQSIIEKNKDNFEKRGINTAKINPEFLPDFLTFDPKEKAPSSKTPKYLDGNSEIVLKDTSAHRTLTTLGDSMKGARSAVNLDGENDDETLLIAMLRNRHIDAGELGSENATSLTTEKRISNLLNSFLGKKNFNNIGIGEDGKRQYAEAIVAGGFTLDDVEEIRLDKNYVETNIYKNFKPKTPDYDKAGEILQRLSINDDLKNVLSIAINPKNSREKEASKEMIERILFVQGLRETRKLREAYRTRVNSKIKTGESPRIIFANSDGLDYDNPKTYKNYQEGMTVDQLLDERLAQDIRDILQRLGRNVASLEEVRQFRKTMIGAEQ